MPDQPYVKINAPDGNELHVPYTGTPPSQADLAHVLDNYMAHAATAKSIQAYTANIAANPPKTMLQELPSALTSKGSVTLPNSGGAVVPLPGNLPHAFAQGIQAIPQGIAQVGNALVTNDLGTFAPPHVDTTPMTGMSQEQARQTLIGVTPVLGGIQAGANAIRTQQAGGPDLAAQGIQYVNQHPFETGAALVGGVMGYGAGAGMVSRVAGRLGATGLSDAAAAEAASAHALTLPFNVPAMISKIAPKVTSALINPQPGDFIQSRSDPSVYGRVTGQVGPALRKSFTVESPSGTTTPVSMFDIDRHAPAAEVDAVVAKFPSTASVLGNSRVVTLDPHQKTYTDQQSHVSPGPSGMAPFQLEGVPSEAASTIPAGIPTGPTPLPVPRFTPGQRVVDITGRAGTVLSVAQAGTPSQALTVQMADGEVVTDHHSLFEPATATTPAAAATTPTPPVIPPAPVASPVQTPATAQGPAQGPATPMSPQPDASATVFAHMHPKASVEAIAHATGVSVPG